MSVARDVPAWVASYIGLPFLDHGRGPQGYDCWGLVRHVLAQQFGIQELPAHDVYAHAKHAPSVALQFREGLAAAWHRLEQDAAAPGDIVVFNRAARGERGVEWWPYHVGLVVAEATMLHIEAGTAAVAERFDAQPWSHHIEGIYRHVTRI